jgi:hypothetical protein
VVFYIVSYILCGDCIQIYLDLFDILYSVFEFLTSGMRALSLADIVGNFFFFFYRFFSKKKKRGSRHSRNFRYISVKILKKQVLYLSSSQKNTQFKKKIARNRVGEVKILKF